MADGVNIEYRHCNWRLLATQSCRIVRMAQRRFKLARSCVLIVASVAGCASPRHAVDGSRAPSAHVAQSSPDTNPAMQASVSRVDETAQANQTRITENRQTDSAKFVAPITRLPRTGREDSAEILQTEFQRVENRLIAPAAANAVDIVRFSEDLPIAQPGPTPQIETNAGGVELSGGVPIDFATALALAAGDNPQVAFARQRINESYAQWQRAEAMWVPSLRGGMNYNKHEGTIQTVEGQMIETSRGSVYSGLGAGAVGAGSPAFPGLVMNFHMRDAIFQPRITGQLLGASRQASRATTNDILFDTANAYNDLLEALAIEAVAKNTLGNTRRLADVTADFAKAGQGLMSDADRAQAEYSVGQIEMRRASEGAKTASVRLARVLSEDPTMTLVPQEEALVPIDMAMADRPLQDLVATGLSNRPELSESRFLVGAAVERLRSERSAPLVPSVLLGLSYAGNGGGLGSDISNFGDRMDFDAVAYWELRNLGWGEQAARAEAQSRVEQARWRQVQVMDQVASEITEAATQVVSRRDEIELARGGIKAAEESYRRNSERIQDALGLPIEALQSIQALDRAQRQYVRSVADFNRAQFRLQRALGWAIQTNL
jgi:outer membrane protein TolC